MKVTYTNDLLQLMQLFERTTRCPLKDCIVTDTTIYYIIPKGMIGKAVGKGAMHVKSLQNKLQKKVKFIEYDPDVAQFVRNLVFPLKIDDVVVEDDKISIRSTKRDVKALIIGRSAKSLNTLKSLVRRYFPITDITVE